MTTTKKTTAGAELVCIICDGGRRDRNGAFTVCALCSLESPGTPEQAA